MFPDRTQAGRALARLIADSVTDASPVVLALPRGGVPVGFEVARMLHAAFDVLLVRKLGVPGQEELACGAIASGGIRVLNRGVIAQSDLSPEVIEGLAQQETLELDRRERLFRGESARLDARDRTVVVVDDGLATGATMLAAVQAVRLQHPYRVVAAAPVASRDARKLLQTVADEVICAQVPRSFQAVGCWYRNFEQVSDAEVRDLLNQFTRPSNTPRTVLQTSGSAGSK